MIYLIDDKKPRQEGYGWNTEKINRHESILKPIYSYEEMKEESFRRIMFEGDNIILFHESFFMGQNRDIIDLRRKIKTALENNINLIIVFFSGSISDREIKNREVFMPVSSLYQNLDIFLEKYGSDDSRIEYLVYGKNPEIERELKRSFTVANNSLKDKNSIDNSESHVILKSISNNTSIKPFNETNEILIPDSSNDNIFHKLISEKLDEKKYQNIYIPICFGSSFVDFNGLRLATALRCTKSKNQLCNIYIYSHIGVNNLIHNEYFDILKTKNVFLIDYKYSAFQKIKSVESELTIEELSKEIQKLKLDPPLNYADSHSIANEWAIHQWAKTIGCDETDELTKVFQNVRTNLYFKYLKTINPISELGKISSDKLIINDNVKPRVLLIDDEADKGWYEIFAYLLGDINGIYTDYLGIDFKKLSSDEIIEKSIEKIFKDDIDIVILDFRLNPSDFENKSSDKLTSVKLLKEIKEINPGVQVIAFSATNKVWNLQALQDAGADDFIFKDGSNNIDQTINVFTSQISLSLKRASWLKPIWNKTEATIEHLEKQRKNHILDGDFTGAISTFLDLGFESLRNDQSKFSNDSAFMYYFLILEALSKQLIDEDTPHKIVYKNKYGQKMNGFKFQFRSTYTFLKEYEGNDFMQVAAGGDLISKNTRIPYNPKFHNLISYAGIEGIDPISIVDLRNKFNHPDLIENRRIAVIEKVHVNNIFEVCYKLLNNL